MCDLKPGDEVVRYRMGPAGPHPLSITPDPEIGHFRKVQRRDLTAWLATKNTIEDPNPVPAKEVS